MADPVENDRSVPRDSRRPRALWRRYVTHTDRPLLQELMFRAHARRGQVARLKTLLLAFAVLVLSLWPTDFFLFREPDVLRVFGSWRLITLVTMGLLYLAVSWLNPVRERTIWSLVLVLSGYFALTGYLFGEVRGLSFPWFYIAYMLPMFAIALAVDIVPRLVAGLLVTAAYTGAYMFNVPGSLQYPDLHQFVPLAGSSVFLFTLIGHTIQHLERVNFFQSRVVQRQKERVRRLARRDQLTGLFNRREFESRFEDEFSRARRYGHDLSVMMLDLDHFKRINDTHGHPAGDAVLRGMGRLLEETTRTVDVPGRYGGEEFAVLLPETPLENARRLAERIRVQLEAASFEGEEGQAFSVTASLGVALRTSKDAEPEDLLRRADRALYRAKDEGRNRVVVADGEAT